LLRELTVGNRAYSYNIDNQAIQFASIFGIVEKRGTLVAIHNRIFEVRITNYFASEKELQDSKLTMRTSVETIIAGNKLNMPLLLEKFANHYYEFCQQLYAKLRSFAFFAIFPNIFYYFYSKTYAQYKCYIAKYRFIAQKHNQH